MQKQKTIRDVLRRDNVIAAFVLSFFLLLSSYPRLLLEVFIRKNFGERYFSLATVIGLIVILSIYPAFAYKLSGLAALSSGGYVGYDGQDAIHAKFWGKYVTWYAYIVLFAMFSYKRWKEVKTLPSVFDFQRYSLDSGDIHPFFFRLPMFGKIPTARKVEIFYEPAPFFILGLFLWLIGQSLGPFLIICSVFYGFGYAGAYYKSDHYIMDIIDDIISKKVIRKVLKHDDDQFKVSGFRFRAHRPLTQEQRDIVADKIVSEFEDDAAVAK